MEWWYRCTSCNAWGFVQWEKRQTQCTCHNCGSLHLPPRPAEQRDAFVDTHEWPVDMEDAVVAVKGRNCTVPGCRRAADTLDHRVAYAKGGRTSVANLWPMCTRHNQSKGDQEYLAWLASFPYAVGFR